MKITKILPLMGLFVILLFSPISQSHALAQLEFDIGDKFTFTVVKASVSNQVNGTEYATTAEDGPGAGDVIEYEVLGIREVESTDFFSPGNQTIVDVNEKIGDSTSKAEITVDSWTVFLILGLFAGLMSFGFPESTTFEKPNTNDTLIADDANAGLPIFVSSNDTMFKELEKSTSSSSQSSTTSGENITESKVDVSLDVETKKFSIEMSMRNKIVGKNSAGENALFDFSFNLIIKIDYARSLVTKLLMEFKTEVKIGDASSFNEFNFDIVEGTVDENFLDSVPSISVYLSLFTIVALSVVLRRKHNSLK